MSNTTWELPNPFIKADGSLLQAGEGWEEQKTYLRQILTEDLYGQAPEYSGRIEAVTEFEDDLWDGLGKFMVTRLFLTDAVGEDGKPVNFKVASIYPTHTAINNGLAIPVVLNCGYVDEKIAKLAVENGFAVITYDFFEVAPDTWDFQKAALAKAYPDYDWMLIRMWGWMQSRVIDWVAECGFADVSKVVAAGHSRYGKASLCCGVYDPRLAVCVAAGSGCGGIGSLRRAGGRYGENTGFVETLGWMMKDHSMLDHWFKSELKAYGAPDVNGHSRENELRFDANFIGSAIAPTPLLILEGLDDNWANTYGTQLSWNAVSEVYHYMGLDDQLGIHFREGGHAFNLEDWTIMIDFCKHILLGEPKTSNYKTRIATDFRVGHSWQNPLDYGKEDLTYEEKQAIERAGWGKGPKEDRWIFEKAKFGMSMAEMFAIYFGKMKK